MKNFNKNLLIIIIALFTYLITYTVDLDPIITALDNLITSHSTSTNSACISTFNTAPYNFSAETAAEKLTLQTVTYENKIIGVADYYNKETGQIVHAEKQLYPDNSLDNQNRMQCDLSLSSSNGDISHTSNASNNTPQESDILNDLLNESARDAHQQRMNENHATQTHNTTKEQLDPYLILQKQSVFHDPRSTLSSPIITAHIDELITFYTHKTNLNSKFQAELDFCKAFKTGKILDLLNQIYDSNLPTAQAAFNELKNLWIRERKHMFLVRNSYNKKELNFITKLGIDIMIKAERALVTRPDYIAEHANPQSLKIIQKYKTYCTQLQQKGDRTALLNEIERLRPIVKKRSDFDTKISLAIAQKTCFDPITTALHEISHVPSLEKSCNYVKNLELRLLTQAQQQNIMNESQMRTWITERYGFDLIDAAHNCYKSRADYVYTPNNQSYFSDKMQPILRNIESKNLPKAHAELVHFEKQIDKALLERNITDPIAQKEYIKKSLGRDVLAVAHKTYEARLDHKKLVESFINIDVNQATATILENNNSYESVAHEMSDLAKQIFVNAYHCNLSNLPKIESHVYNSIEAMRIAQDHPTFIFNFSMVNHTLSDIQQLAHAILSGKHPVLKRSSELLIKGFDTFFKGLNPLTQASNLGHLASNLGSFLKKSGTALWNDPITVIHNGITKTFNLTELIRNTADFTSDLIVGKLYLSPEEYKQRTDAFCAIIEPLRGITAEHCVEFVAQIAADAVFFKGLGNAYGFLKEIDVLEKLGESAATVARILKKGFDTHLANNPVVVTAEGVTIKISKAMHNINVSGSGKNIINNTRALFESAYAKTAIELEDKIKKIREFYILQPVKDLINFGNKDIKIALEHILGMELHWNNEGLLLKIGGFHHDFMGAIEKSNIFKFANKIIQENGCYSANLVVDGREISKTFFPQHWTQETVVSKIYEAYNNFINNGGILTLEKDGKYIVEGLTNEAITIRMHITQKGLIKTAFPIIK